MSIKPECPKVDDPEEREREPELSEEEPDEIRMEPEDPSRLEVETIVS